MGIFSEADGHPFIESDVEPVDEAHGGSSIESWLEDQRSREFVRAADRPRGLFVRDDILLS